MDHARRRTPRDFIDGSIRGDRPTSSWGKFVGKFNVEEIRREARISDYVSNQGVKITKNGREFIACCPLHREKTPSFSIYPGRDGAERFHCFGCAESGDVVDFVMALHGVAFPEACEILGGRKDAPTQRRELVEIEHADPYDGFKIARPPADAIALAPGSRTPELLNPKRLDADGKIRSIRYTPSLVHEYRAANGELLFYVLRIDLEGGKKITPTIAWARNKALGFSGWTHFPIPQPRPLYGLEDLAARPGHQVLVVEGEKCRDVAREAFPSVVPVSWCGGGKATHKTNWKPLADRRVVIWPDNDPEGLATTWGYWHREEWRPGLIEAAILAGAETVKLIEPPGEVMPKGWDVADAVQKDGWTPARILEYAKANTRVVSLAEVQERKDATAPARTSSDGATPIAPQQTDDQAETEGASPHEERPTVSAAISRQQAKPAEGERDVKPLAARKQAGNVVSLHGGPIPAFGEDWRGELIMDDNGKLKPKLLNNAVLMIANHEKLAGIFAYNEFTQSVYVANRPPWQKGNGGPWIPRPLKDTDVTWLVTELERFGLTFKTQDIGKAITIATDKYRINPVREYLDGLKWDGTSRIRGGTDPRDGIERKPWLCEYMGSPDQPIIDAFGMRWLISAVARVFEPGCKVDTMLILEGNQGARKSSAMRLLGTFDGQSYFTDEIAEVGTKDSSQQLHGAWIVELAELDALSRADTASIKAWISRQVDRFRPPYAATVEEFKRSNVFVGTVNPTGIGYLKDPSGGRRFMPAPVTRVDLERLAADKAQLWAEAVFLYKSGEQWWLTDEEEIEAGRVQASRFETDPWATLIDKETTGKSVVFTDEIADTLGIPKERRNIITEKRIASHLKAAGFTRKKKRDLLGRSRWGWEKETAPTD
jgi:predicted P-loop ATPase